MTKHFFLFTALTCVAVVRAAAGPAVTAPVMGSPTHSPMEPECCVSEQYAHPGVAAELTNGTIRAGFNNDKTAYQRAEDDTWDSGGPVGSAPDN
ncbi:hypothetical protein [uncultured Roseobacter sp.]|uniref:hypothetical protein n=1 Tax=uncultured Roseobacter sp. TaxID=114847 RepID=UPI00260E5F2B|nr:hypothetical protein [uncultured Roseobacter sp.]